MIIHPHIPKHKPKKPNARQRALKDSWNQLLSKYEPKKPVSKIKVSQPKPFRRETLNYPSLSTYEGNCAKPETIKYTGDAMIGIATMHKSNPVPVFSTEDAIEISRMRRG